MTPQQKQFLTILEKHSKINHTFFTSNDFHTIWDAMKDYEQFKKDNLSKALKTRLLKPCGCGYKQECEKCTTNEVIKKILERIRTKPKLSPNLVTL